MDNNMNISNHYDPSISAFSSDSSMFVRPNQVEEHQIDEQNNLEALKIDSHPLNVNKKREKKTVSFPFGQCRICHDTATGVHYGVVTCEGCKGFFKRSITQGVPYRCFFGDRCIINMETRNRCKACRFKRCMEQGMAIESVKMGRIPKKLKEKALRDYHKQQERTLQRSEEENYYPEFLHNNGNIDDDDNDNDTETEIYELDLADPSDKRNSVSSFSSFSSSSSSSVPPQLSADSQHDIIIIPQGMLHRSEQPLRTVDLIELTISGSNNCVDHLNNNLSSLRLPNVFYESFPFEETAPGKPHVPNSPLNDENQTRKNDNDSAVAEDLRSSNSITVSNYISDLNQKCVVDYMFGFELRYAKNVLPMMKYLAPRLSQPFLIYELDFEVSSFFRYIRWKMFNFYLKHTQRIRGWVERMFGIIHLGITDYPGLNATRDQMWTAVQAGIPTHVNEFVAFTRDTPGLNELNHADLNQILNNRVFDYWVIMNYPVFYQNESYVMTDNGLHYTRYFMNQFIGTKTTDAIHEFCQRLHALNITHVEHSLIIPIILCLPDKQIVDAESVRIIKYCYMYALYIQMSTTRTEDEAKSIFDRVVQLVDGIPYLNELCMKNIGELVLDNAS